MNPITRMMKRDIKTPLSKTLPLLLICAILLVAIAGCTSPQSNPTPSPSNVATTPSPKVTASPTASPTKKPTTTPTPTPTSQPQKQPPASPAPTSSNAGPFIGSKNSNVYHYPGCSYVSRIKPANQVTFPTAAAAQAAGYHPCSVCQPPL